MKRRDFIKKTVGTGIAAGTAFSIVPFNKAFGTARMSSAMPYDLVAIKGGTATTMFDKAIAELGGMSAFVKPGQTVVVKPNIGWDATPEKAADTNPELVGRIVEHCFKAGAKSVHVFDNPCNEWTRCYKNSGIEDAVKKAGGIMVTGKTQSHYKKVNISKGVNLKTAEVHELILNSDVFLNVPVLKHHGGALITISMKNLMGVVWDRSWWHGNDLHQCIADFSTFRAPDLNIVDAYRVMKRNGPRGVSVADVATMQYQFIGKDMVAVDTAATKVFGLEVEKVKYIGMAEKLGTGTTKLDTLNIKRISL